MEVMTAAEVAKYLKVNRETVYRGARAGEIPHFKVSGKLTIDRWIEEQEHGRPEPDNPKLLKFQKSKILDSPIL